MSIEANLERIATALEKIADQGTQVLARTDSPAPAAETAEVVKETPAASKAGKPATRKAQEKPKVEPAPEPETETPEPDEPEQEQEEALADDSLGATPEQIRNTYLLLMKKVGGPKAKEIFSAEKTKIGKENTEEMTPQERLAVVEVFESHLM